MNTNHNLSIVRLVLVLFIFVVYVVKVEANQVQPEAFYHNSNQLELLSDRAILVKRERGLMKRMRYI
ncbi:hypothetical protein B296_00051831 [Ensete ventricosum]|uniref:Uncharacterized protein n=1 Tax=Ensete ventricosum TaxID=4639 RepID=A0A426YF92_ENSVE|nr:hypothetical protein B296_00051831 [Ensete ventricosum]